MSEADKGAKLTTIAAVVILGALLYVAFAHVDDWARIEFAEAPLASMLVAVIDLALFAAALCLAPALSAVLARATGRKPPRA